jgi:hypothetical protein
MEQQDVGEKRNAHCSVVSDVRRMLFVFAGVAAVLFGG